jgi:YcxB-like protein
VRYQLQITYDDYKAALILHMRPRRGLRVVVYCILGLFVIGLVIISYRLFQGWADSKDVIFIGCILYIAAYFCIFLPYRCRKLYRQQKVLHQPLEYEFSQEAFVICTAFGNSTLPWKLFQKWKEGKGMFLIYQTDVMFHAIPKRIFREKEEEQTVRQALFKAIGGPRP